MRDAPTTQRREEFVSGMDQSKKDAGMKVVPTDLCREEFAGGTVQTSSSEDAAMKDARIKL